MMTQPDALALSHNSLQLRAGTFNVRWADPGDGEHRWDLRRERFVEFVRSWAPDVLGLQEPLRPQLDFILNALPEYGWVGVGRIDGVADGEFCPILFRRDRFRSDASGTFWLSSSPETPGQADWGSRTPRICTWTHLIESASERGFYHYNVHLDHESQAARDNGIALVLDRIRGRALGDPVLLTGDFNAYPENPAVTRVLAPDAPLAAMAAAEGGTFHGFTGTVAGGPIDYLFVSPGWTIIDARVLTGDGKRPYVSDHFAVAAALQLV